MRINLTGQNMKVTDALKDFTSDKFDRLGRHSDHIMDVHIVLSVEKLLHNAHATLHLPGHDLHASDTSDDMYKSIDGLVDKLDRLLKKVKHKH